MLEQLTNNIDSSTPLGVIAIFAALTAIAGSIALPFVKEKDIQTKFVVGFLIPFPFAVLLLFFGTLWHNHTKFYAPKDYRSDQAFQDVWETGKSQHQVDLVGIKTKLDEATKSNRSESLVDLKGVVVSLIQKNVEEESSQPPSTDGAGYFAYSDTFFQGERELAIAKANERRRALGGNAGLNVYVFRRTYGTERWAVVFGPPDSRVATQQRIKESKIPLYLNLATGWNKEYEARP